MRPWGWLCFPQGVCSVSHPNREEQRVWVRVEERKQEPIRVNVQVEERKSEPIRVSVRVKEREA